ncbi:TFIIA-alpha and beta-like factor isoform X2 [Sinocyclocheilus rhinocerous]|uniref:TFIIA-alpha and beta-like factor isoform X2 n=1 Tax=Sinocyclocheilus rhinocerous TaxID=307959 RepID=UPI0007B9AFD1|nr:PREDICTED: TFIIA-alpha and beta-like factor isoform X2 [Sinocyclocheilus rhinocerous]
MMLSSANTLPKLYLSVIEDVIESIRELFCDEGVEGRVLDNLRQLWESKVIQSKAVEGFMKDNNPSNFVLQLPANYSQSLHKPTVVIPAAQNVPSFSSKASSCGSVATFSLPAGITYPVQIPAGVTLQTASGHFYKVNVPVMVTRGAQHVLNPAAVARSSALTHLSDPGPAASVCETPLNRQSADGASLSASNAQSEFTLDGIEFSPQPADMSTPPAQALRSDYSRQQREQSTALPDLQTEAAPDIKLETELQTELKFNQLLDITQLDGVADSSSDTEEDDDDDDDLGLVGEKEFLGMINATEEEELEEEEIHRSKNRWKFYLKDGVMSYGGKDYVFSKAVGEAEW